MRKILKSLMPLALIVVSTASQAGVVTNDTDLLSGTGHEKLSEWLGQDVNLTRIFAKGVDGSTSYDWHDHVDGMGATFTIMELFDSTTNERTVIGGYNSNDWVSTPTYSKSASNFLFNLTNRTVYKTTGQSDNFHASYNRDSYGSTFGGGHDLYVKDNLTTGYANIGYTYGDSSKFRQNQYMEEFAGSYDNWTIGAYETFTLSDSTGGFGMGATASLTESGEPNSVPVPFALAGLSLLGLGFARRK